MCLPPCSEAKPGSERVYCIRGRESEMDGVAMVLAPNVFLDVLFGNRVPTPMSGAFQVSGEYRTGKTQMAHTLCVTAQMGVDQYVQCLGTPTILGRLPLIALLNCGLATPT